MMRFKVAQSYDILEARRDTEASGPDNRPFRNLELELDLAPIPYLTLSTRNKIDVNTGAWQQNNYDLTLSDSRGDRASAGYRYTRDTIEEINLSLRAVLTSTLGATYVVKLNRLDDRTVEHAVGLQYRKQCWTLEVNVQDKADDRTIMVYLSLSGLGGSW
jgi:hypothetical protein